MRTRMYGGVRGRGLGAPSYSIMLRPGLEQVVQILSPGVHEINRTKHNVGKSKADDSGGGHWVFGPQGRTGCCYGRTEYRRN